ncbi:MAG: hypothetical protein LBR50_01765 [Tannerella sp.]|nr:hypothetical protein [Tannerella sp.]
MKKVNYLMIMLAATMLFAGCEKDDELPEVDETTASIAAKWVNKDKTSKYASFEFLTDGTYVVSERINITKSAKAKAMTLRVASLDDVKLPETPFLRIAKKSDKTELRASTPTLAAVVGKYVIHGDVIELTDYGMISDFQASNDEFEFTFKPDGSVESIEFVGTKEASISDSKNTTLMCRMWHCESIEIDGGGLLGDLISGIGLNELLESLIRVEVNGKTLDLCVMMSKAGTYLSIFRDSEGNYYTEIDSDGGFMIVSTVIGKWEWYDSNEKKVKWSEDASFDVNDDGGVWENQTLTTTDWVIVNGDTEATLGMNYKETFTAVNKF